jgi:hypothetical protein
VTAGNFKRLKNLTGGLSAVNPEQVEWFSPNTGDASIYYFKSAAGDFEFTTAGRIIRVTAKNSSRNSGGASRV